MEWNAELRNRLLSRRQLLRYSATAAALATLPRLLRLQPAAAAALSGTSPGGYLTSTELAILDAATATIIPTDSTAGARDCGVVNYIQGLLSFLPGSDANCDHQVTAADLVATASRVGGQAPSCRQAGDVDGSGVIDSQQLVAAEAAVFDARPIFAGGPFSGRQPQPHFNTGATSCSVCHGVPFENSGPVGLAATDATVDNFPPKSFTQFLPLSRLQALSWKIRLLGVSAVPAVATNPLAADSLEADLRKRYRNGLALVDEKSQLQHGKPFVELTAQQQSDLVNDKTDQAFADFVTLLTYHTIEGMLSVPEYGGNRNRLGWQLVGFDGDSQPLGYTIYDASIGGYRERPEKPNSGPNPNEDCHGFSRRVLNFLNALVTLGPVQDPTMKPARYFRDSAYCLDVQP